MTPTLTDLSALRRQRSRALAGQAQVQFLHDAAIAEVQERADMVNRSFPNPAVVTGFEPFWSSVFPDARIVPDEDRLELAAGAHDLVVHAMGLHWSNDPVGQLVQCRRALKPDGLFLGVCFGGKTLQELREVLAEAESRLRGGLAPRVAPMGEIRDLGALLQRAGFAMPVADSLPIKVSYETLFHLLRDLRAMGETNALATRDRRSLPKGVLSLASELYAQRFAEPKGRIRATFELILLTGWAPADTQPKPLRPGTATTRLADALSTSETALPRETRFDD